jgi:NAD+ kinase
MDDILSPDAESFSTPPSTPGNVLDQRIKPSLSRKSSHLSSIHIPHSRSDWNRDLVVDQTTSPSESKGTAPSRSPAVQAQKYERGPTRQTRHPRAMDTSQRPLLGSSQNGRAGGEHTAEQNTQPLNSPCFIHSYLDKNVSLTDWLKSKQQSGPDNGDVNVARSLQQNGLHPDLPSDTSPRNVSPNGSISIGSNDEEDFGPSLTKQLAETAVTVREMSKQLGVSDVAGGSLCLL